MELNNDNGDGNPNSQDFKMNPMEEKLKIIDQELRLLHEFCMSKGYDTYKIELHAKPVLGLLNESRKKRYKTFLSVFIIFMIVFLGVCYIDPLYKRTCAYSRLAFMKVLPYWDWTSVYHEECLIHNPYFVGTQLHEEDCQMCEDLELIERINNVSINGFSEDFLKRDIPAIITDGMDGWLAQEKFSIPFLYQLYTTEDSLKDLLPCMFQSNVRAKFNNPKFVLGKGSKGEITGWYAHWENCEKNAGKTLRQFYRRPYFVPPMVAMAESNWIFVASHYKGKKNKPADIAQPMMLFAQVKGESKVILTPRNPCNESCSTLYAVLKPGEILMVTDMMWMLDYMPQGNPETIAIGMGGYFDY